MTITEHSETSVLLTGLAFGEGPRWHDDRLWFSDMHAREVLAVDVDGKVERIVTVEHEPSGLGWLPDGRLLVVSMQDRRLLCLEADGLREVVDLNPLTGWYCNDMVVDTRGRAYVGNFGYDLYGHAEPAATGIVLVTPDGAARIVAEDLAFPNGMVIDPSGSTLIVGESGAGRLTAFSIADDGSLGDRRLFAQLEGAVPDGICLDAEGAVWLACPVTGRALRMREGGEVTDVVQPSRIAYACMLGGADRRTLFLCTARTHDPAKAEARRDGCIETISVTVPGAGLP